jgi:hypothetical protein
MATTLVGIREQFARQSGRHDLVTNFAAGTYTDNGANFFINAGQRMLDRKAGFLKSYSWYKDDIAADSYKVEFPNCQSIKEVYLANADGRTRLIKKTLRWIRDNYPSPIADLDSGTSAYYCPLVIGLEPSQSALTASGVGIYTTQFTYDYEELMFKSGTTEHWNYNGILIMPPTEDAMTVSILGRFKSKDMSTDTDQTWWTEQHPDLLILAAMWSLEGFYRNTEGQRDYMNMIVDGLNDLDKDMVEEEVQDADEMEG